MNGADGRFDVVLIGGGPTGSAAAIRARRRGLSVVVIEGDRHPRFPIGESFLPRQTTLLRELGLLERVQRLPHVPKHGASFAMAHEDRMTDFWFPPDPCGEAAAAMNMERSLFDECLLSAAGEAGATVLEGTRVRRVERLAAGDVVLETTGGVVRGRLLIDASGQGTVVGRHLGTRRALPDLCRVAYFQHFTGVDRREGTIAGHPIIVMCDEGWFWMIPLDSTRTSVGLVMQHEVGKATGVQANRMLAWGIERSPFVRARMAGAKGDEDNHVCADFSYTCAPYAGDGYFLAGDAATFVDPIFSTGVCMGMMSGVRAADAAAEILAGPESAGRRGRAKGGAAQEEYIRFIESSSSIFFGLVRKFYGHGFREMFLRGTGPLGVHRAVLALLAGHVFPRPVFSLRWRLTLFGVLLGVHSRFPLVPRRTTFSLSRSAPPVSTRAHQQSASPTAAAS